MVGKKIIDGLEQAVRFAQDSKVPHPQPTPRELGAHARHRGADSGDNPYKPAYPTERIEWAAGWKEQDQATEIGRLQEHCKMLDNHLGIALSALRQFEREVGQQFDSRGEVEAIEEEWSRRTTRKALAADL